ncbi:MAG: hypothetical protein Kow0099_20930 [Candidatus Abyssubacteria bacterium]
MAGLATSWKRLLARANKIQNKIFIPFVIVMVLIGAMTIYAMTDLVSANVEARVNDKLNQDVRIIQEVFSDMEKSLAFYSQFMADTEKLAGHISEARDSRLILIYLLEFLKENQIYSYIGGGTAVPGQDPSLSRLGMLGIRTTGVVPSSEHGKSAVSIAAVSPIEGRAGSRSVITVGRVIDTAFLQSLRQKTGAHKIEIYYRGELVGDSSEGKGCSPLTHPVSLDVMRRTLNGDAPYLTEFECGEHSVKMALAPLSVNHRKEMLVAVYELIDDLVKAKNNILRTTAVVVGLMLIIVVPVYVMTVSRTVHPIRLLSMASKKVAEGDLNQYVPVKTWDEVGELSDSFNQMVADLKKYRQELEQWNQTLEERVAERGRQLADAQAKLIQSTKLAAVGELAAGLAHELNNPLAGIYAFLQVFAETVRSRGLKTLSDEEVRGFEENLVYVEREIQRCKSIVGSLLTFARVSEKHFRLLDLNEVVRDTLGFMQTNLKKGNITVKTDFAESLPAVMGDSNELQQVFLNIVVNARKAMPQGGTLFVATRADEDTRNVHVSMRDTGEGINSELMDKIFDPFFTTRKPGEGTGLGLSISYGIIKDHNGEILVESEIGKGATFTVVLPFAEEQPGAPTPLTGAAPSEKRG